MSSDLARRLRDTYHVADLPEDSVIRLASDALDAARSQVEAAHKRAAEADALLEELADCFPHRSHSTDEPPNCGLTIQICALCSGVDDDHQDGCLIARIDAHLGGGNGNG